jgi:prepilin-type N-terminal cleavage/methylation domain-containing protein
MKIRPAAGFTLIELILAMAVFSGALLIIVGGFLNIMRLSNQSISFNVAQDNARKAMDDVVATIRSSSSTVAPTATAGVLGTLCLRSSKGPDQYYDVVAGRLRRSNNCSTPSGSVFLTQSNMRVQQFVPIITDTGLAGGSRPQINITMTVSSAAGTTGTGAATKCVADVVQRTFCSVVTINSGATPR